MSRERRPPAGNHSLAGLFQLLMSVDAATGSSQSSPTDTTDDDFLSSHRLAQGIADRLAKLEDERSTAPSIVADLMASSPLDRYDQIATRPEIASWGTVEQLVRTGRELAERQDPSALDRFDLALALLPRLDTKLYGAACVEDLAGRTWTQLAQSRLRLGDLDGAEQALDHAQEHLLDGTGDVLEKAQRFEVEAEIQATRGRLTAALAAIDRAIAVFRSTNDRHLGGLARLAKANILRAAGRLDEGIQMGLSGVTTIDQEREPQRVIAAYRALAADLDALGRSEEAAAQRATAERLERELAR